MIEHQHCVPESAESFAISAASIWEAQLELRRREVAIV